VKVGLGIADVMCGMYAAVGILAALHHRDATGEGQCIDLALYDAQVAWLINAATNHLVSGKVPGRIGNRHPNIAPYQTFGTADGEIAIAVGNDQQFARFCVELGLPDLALDERFRRNRDRVIHMDALDGILSDALKADGAEAWERRLVAAGIPAGRVATIDQVLSDPHTVARDMVVEMPAGDGGTLRLLGNPLKMSATPVRFDRPPPHVGEHGDEIMAELALAEAAAERQP
jgi:crotonobetainyl-CoA:carnitine CoA-transferase CaiB-like acyl-CoA transferase